MRFVIVGPGALGAIFADALQRDGHGVILLGRPSPWFTALQTFGLHLRSMAGAERIVDVAITDDPSVAQDAEVLLVLVKAGDTTAALRGLALYFPEAAPVVTLQNGLGNAQAIRAALGPDVRVLPGVTSQAGTRAAPNLVVHSGTGPTLIGHEDRGDGALAAELAAVLTRAGLRAVAVADIQCWIWRKAAVNAAINGLTAIGEFPNGVIAENPALLDAAVTIAEEAATVAHGLGLDLGAMREAVRETAEATAANRSSMLQDLQAGRVTEVDAIHGAIQTTARSLGIATPAIDVLTALIREKTRTKILEDLIGGKAEDSGP